MTASAQPTPPPNPAAARRTRLLGPSFWAFLIFSLVCVGAGAAVAVYGPKLLSGAAQRVGAVRPSASPPRLFAFPAAPPPPASAPASPAPDARLAEAAAAERAIAGLADVAQRSGPFVQALEPLGAYPTLAVELNALRPLAQTGAPSRAALAASFADHAARAAGAGAAPAPDAGFVQQARYALSRIVSVRRVGDVPGDSLDARLARAERGAADGDLETALGILDTLPPAARDAVGPWRALAERRVEIDRRIAALRVTALAAPAAGGAP